jgi:uridine phosphorylase
VKAPILDNKRSADESVFDPKALLREARRQKGMDYADVPGICVLDPDGDIVHRLRAAGQSRPFKAWPCYHTSLDIFTLADIEIGIIGRVVGAPFAVLVAEELFASGCKLLISITSAGQVNSAGELPYFVVIDRALRDEGTSYHYAEPAQFAHADPKMVELGRRAVEAAGFPPIVGASWTTDAPFRETAAALASARALGILTVEMEAAALYSFASAKRGQVLCFAHVTNTMGQADIDFEKGEGDGTLASLALLEAVVRLATEFAG